MPWLLKFILPAAIDFIFKAVLAVLKDKVKDNQSQVDDKILNVIENEQDELKNLIIEKSKKLGKKK